MKFSIISDNHDTLMGLRLAGISGVIAHDADSVRRAITAAINDESVGVVLITEQLVPLCPELIYELKLNRRRPLIVEIPDRHSAGRTSDSITKYVKEAIGVNITAAGTAGQ